MPLTELDLTLLESRVCGYKTKRSAADAALYVNTSAEPLKPYRCPFCDCFHVGHEPTGRRAKKLRKALRYIDERGYVSAR